jgi:hypothetical protein
MHKFLEKVKKELKEMEEKPTLSMGEWQRVQILTDIEKNILKIKMLEGGGSSYDPDESYERGYSERRMRDSRGRFRSSYDGAEMHHGGSYGDSSYDGGYRGGSYGDGNFEGKHDMIRDLRGMMERCKDHESREIIQKWMNQLENAR